MHINAIRNVQSDGDTDDVVFICQPAFQVIMVNTNLSLAMAFVGNEKYILLNLLASQQPKGAIFVHSSPFSNILFIAFTSTNAIAQNYKKK